MTNECVAGQIREERKKINSVTRMGYIHSYFDARLEVQDEFKSMTRPKVAKGKLWTDAGFGRTILRTSETKDTDIVWKRPKVG